MAGTSARYSLTHGIPATRIGWLVAEARTNAGLAQEDLAERLGCKRRAVKRWEKGSQIPSDDDVLAIARACRIGVGVLFPPRDTVEFDRSTRSMRVGGAMVSVADVHNEAVLTTYVQLVRQQRGLPEGATFEIRHEDVDALATTLDLEDDELEARLVTIVGMAADAAAGMRERLVSRRRMTLPAGLMVGSLGLVPGAAATAHADGRVAPPLAAVAYVSPDEIDRVDAVDADVAVDADAGRGGQATVDQGPSAPVVEIADAVAITNPSAAADA